MRAGASSPERYRVRALKARSERLTGMGERVRHSGVGRLGVRLVVGHAGRIGAANRITQDRRIQQRRVQLAGHDCGEVGDLAVGHAQPLGVGSGKDEGRVRGVAQAGKCPDDLCLLPADDIARSRRIPRGL